MLLLLQLQLETGCRLTAYHRNGGLQPFLTEFWSLYVPAHFDSGLLAVMLSTPPAKETETGIFQYLLAFYGPNS